MGKKTKLPALIPAPAPRACAPLLRRGFPSCPLSREHYDLSFSIVSQSEHAELRIAGLADKSCSSGRGRRPISVWCAVRCPYSAAACDDGGMSIAFPP